MKLLNFILIMSIIQSTTSIIQAASPATQPIYSGSRVIGNDSLMIEMVDPNAEDRYYKGVRFSPVAAIISAVLNGQEFLFHSENHDPKTDVAGLFSEFDLTTPPPGFDEAENGQSFLKIGVGSLVKTTGKYQFYTPYPIGKLAATSAKWEQDQVTFDQIHDHSGNFAYHLKTRVEVKQNQLIITWILNNTGTREIKTHHYTHNSFRFMHQIAGPDYLLMFPFNFPATGLRSDVIQDGSAIRFTKPIEKPINIAINYPGNYQGENEFTLSNSNTKQSVTAHTSIPGERVALHIAPQYICPEQFVFISVKPGESRTWMRRYTFTTGGSK